MSHIYSESTLPSSATPEQLKLYSWLPNEPWRAAVFLLHGFRAHTRYNFLRNDVNGARRTYGEGTTPQDTSLVRELNLRNIAVFGHDHVGHGQSTGLRAYFPSFQTLVDDVLSHVKHIDAQHELSTKKMPVFLIGHSMGGTLCILAAQEAPHLFTGVALSSAATEPPASMFGLKGRINYSLSGITSALIPKMELVQLPKSIDPEQQALFDGDELNCKVGIRARVGREFLNTYSHISQNADKFNTPFLSVSGEHDTLVNPLAAKRFYDKAPSTDKTLHTAVGRWHNLFAEKGKEDMWNLFTEWVDQRIK
ncbi:Monoglyceride lipase [Gracilariopsis chorda]|uniref:Monoglyceride lipase n=1 Tax=Gracilariopsis chorda TaxID=448386 RepID=A0A2V3IFT5_9FLOR|nr:Monoglyceride lipase [Gracilariopsis chorda]|eukprot:PXF40937.1 Monoglyceride lipase [Gracilariopsis chorda]